jgi:very-short-patch-repair endonuclease
MTKHNLFHDESMWKGAGPEIFERAKALRNNMTIAEAKLWDELKGNKLSGLKFRRQHPVHHFIVDFYCHKHELVIEIDGEYHETKKQIELDKERTEILNKNGLKIIRFSNKQVLENIEEVKIEILKVINLD